MLARPPPAWSPSNTPSLGDANFVVRHQTWSRRHPSQMKPRARPYVTLDVCRMPVFVSPLHLLSSSDAPLPIYFASHLHPYADPPHLRHGQFRVQGPHARRLRPPERPARLAEELTRAPPRQAAARDLSPRFEQRAGPARAHAAET